MKKLISLVFVLTLAALIVGGFSSCAGTASGNSGGEVTGIGVGAWNEPVPYGMVLVERGSILSGVSKPDSLRGIKADSKPISVESFWMDETEITNAKYKQFVHWVRDSIIRERLADPAYGGNAEFRIEADKEGNPIGPYLNWAKAIPWRMSLIHK